MSIDLHPPLLRDLSAIEIASILAFVLYAVACLTLLLRRNLTGLLGLALLWPWLLFQTEFAVVRDLEAFVLYRSYPWIIGVCAAISLVVGRLPKPVAVIGVPLLCIGFSSITLNRLATFASDILIWDDAVQKLPTDVSHSPGAYRPYLNRGLAFVTTQRFDDALRDFAVATKLAPDDAVIHLNTALALVGLKRNSEALQELNIGLNLATGFQPHLLAAIYSNRAAVFLLLDRPLDAIADLQHAIVLDHTRADLARSRELLIKGLQKP